MNITEPEVPNELCKQKLDGQNSWQSAKHAKLHFNFSHALKKKLFIATDSQHRQP